MINKLKTKKAFTIIEVVLVLGIASLIILAMFVAIPALQRSKRNQIRQDDMLRIMKAVVSYQGNHSGKVPVQIRDTNISFDYSFPKDFIDSGVLFAEEYMPSSVWAEPGKTGINTYEPYCESGKDCSDFVDPDGTLFNIVATNYDGQMSATANREGYMESFDHYIYFITNSRCASSNDGEIAKSNNVNDLSILYLKENGVAFCIDNQ